MLVTDEERREDFKLRPVKMCIRDRYIHIDIFYNTEWIFSLSHTHTYTHSFLNYLLNETFFGRVKPILDIDHLADHRCRLKPPSSTPNIQVSHIIGISSGVRVSTFMCSSFTFLTSSFLYIISLHNFFHYIPYTSVDDSSCILFHEYHTY